MRGNLVEHEDLQAVTGYSRLADLERCLDRAGVRYFRGRDGLWTTLDLINAAGGLDGSRGDVNEPYSADQAA